jgi:hypothetical protein
MVFGKVNHRTTLDGGSNNDASLDFSSTTALSTEKSCLLIDVDRPFWILQDNTGRIFGERYNMEREGTE